MKNDRSDPNYVGPGVWVSIHIESSSARNKQSQESFCANVREICDKFPCLNCSEHCKSYIKNNPPEKFIGIKMLIDGKYEEIGVSIWSWTFHNSVNLRLGKPCLDWDTYQGMYIKTEKVCSEKCSLSNFSPQNKKIKNKMPTIPNNLLKM